MAMTMGHFSMPKAHRFKWLVQQMISEIVVKAARDRFSMSKPTSWEISESLKAHIIRSMLKWEAFYIAKTATLLFSNPAK